MFNFIIFLSFTFSSLYIWSSGLPQFSHILLLFLSVLLLVKKQKIFYHHSFVFLLFFVLYSSFVNVIYFLLYFDFQFLTSTIQIIFNAFIFLVLTNYFKSANNWEYTVVLGIAVSYVLQWFIFIFGLGNYNLAPRYAGSFNDPNQMAFWFLCTFSIFLIIKDHLIIRFPIYIFLIVTFLTFILLSMSRSALLSIIFYLTLLSIYFIFNLNRKFLTGFIISSFIFGFLFFNYFEKFDYDTVLDRISNTNIHQQAEERGYTRFSENPEYIFLGSGQGEHKRFNLDKSSSFLDVEMHTTWGGILFYYGIPGFLSICLFIYLAVFFPSSIMHVLIVTSTFAYGITTYSFRTPIFWLLLAVLLGSNLKKKRNY